MTSKIITIHIEYDPNVSEVPNDVAVAVDVLNELHFKEVIEKKLRAKLSPNQFKLIRVQVK